MKYLITVKILQESLKDENIYQKVDLSKRESLAIQKILSNGLLRELCEGGLICNMKEELPELYSPSEKFFLPSTINDIEIK